ncbi:hypothetical protein EVAR_61248_1 [Eumeta japonica]|uniref:Uncharacterized protein n=1 Tax=Eumeta variegata TaxID=151549 RepID=A0A4C1Z675_EUMVA|nr:hypothetical protein EVAR_61248_1 [Eumeta japonica]
MPLTRHNAASDLSSINDLSQQKRAHPRRHVGREHNIQQALRHVTTHAAALSPASAQDHTRRPVPRGARQANDGDGRRHADAHWARAGGLKSGKPRHELKDCGRSDRSNDAGVLRQHSYRHSFYVYIDERYILPQSLFQIEGFGPQARHYGSERVRGGDC